MEHTVKGFPHYTISEDGVVKSKITGNVIKGFYRKTKLSRRRVALYIDNERYTRTVSRLVAQTFIPNPLRLPMVNHKDGNPSNDYYTNLEWCTNRDNIIHAYKHRLISLENKRKGAKKGKDNPNSTPIKAVCKNTGVIFLYDCIRDFAKEHNMKNTASLYQALREPHRTVYGFYLKYR